MENALIAGGILVVAVLLIGGAGFIASISLYKSAGSPVFWVTLSSIIWKELKPRLIKVFFDFVARNSPEIEKLMQACNRMGGTWDNWKKVCRFGSNR